MATPQEAVDTLLRAGTGLGTRVNGLGITLTDDYLKAAAVSRDGRDVIVRLTPDQALKFVDLIHQNED